MFFQSAYVPAIPLTKAPLPDWDAPHKAGMTSESAALALLRRDQVRRRPFHRHVAGLVLHPREPAADCRIVGQFEIALLGHVRIGVQRDGRDGEMLRGKKM